MLGIPWDTFVAEWVHVFAGILWFGGALYNAFVLIPSLNRLPMDTQRSVANAIGQVAPTVFRIAAVVTIVMGVLRGTVWGRLDSFDALKTQYGTVWTIALIAAIATFLWAEVAILPKLRRIQTDPALVPAADGTLSAEAEAFIARLKLVTILELIGFLVIFTCMVLLQFS